MIVNNPLDVVTILTIIRDSVATVIMVVGAGYLFRFSFLYGQGKQYFLGLVQEARNFADRLVNNHLAHLQDSSERTAEGISGLQSDLRNAATLVVAAKDNESAHHVELLDALISKQNEKG